MGKDAKHWSQKSLIPENIQAIKIPANVEVLKSKYDIMLSKS